MDNEHDVGGVVFPLQPDGRRSTSALGRSVVTDALRSVDPTGAKAAERDTNWRSGYLTHLRHLTVAGLGSRSDAVTIAHVGLDSLHHHMRVVGADGHDRELSSLQTVAPEARLETIKLDGQAEPEHELIIPYRGHRLQGDALRRQLDLWVSDGIIEPSCATAVRQVIDHPDWLSVPERTMVVLGAGAEMGPLPALLRWGATVAAVDLPRPDIWTRILSTAHDAAGTLILPVAPRTDPADDRSLDARAGLDLVDDVPAAAEWINQLVGPLLLGNYAYADGSTHVRVATAVDAMTTRVHQARDDVALAFLATPTDAFAVPADTVAKSVQAYEDRSRAAKVMARPLRTVSGGRLLRRAYAPGVDPGICDALVPQQGPNYALAKRVHRWRATVARDQGTLVSMHVAPATRTRSVMKNRALAAAYTGAHRFGVEIFDPDTTNTLMAALLVHDLHTGGVQAHDQVWQDEAHAAAHGGLWTCAYAPRSALGLAALLGVGGARS
ncbi:hypothetical protein BH24ACT15_BH24ACT15_25220 [soil metagenome]